MPPISLITGIIQNTEALFKKIQNLGNTTRVSMLNNVPGISDNL